jgi:hypothetical protein
MIAGMTAAATAALSVPPAAEMVLDAQPEHDERSTTFLFEHKVFDVPDVYFALTSDRKPALHISYGDLRAQIETRSLRRGFAIAPESADDRMLAVVEQSLRFVRRIRPNDSIPREVLDGTASWAADEIHREIAHGRLTLQLASWMTGNTAHVRRDQIGALVNNPAVVERVQAAVAEIAQRIGIANDEKQVIVDRIAAFAQELSYVEAIRERFDGMRLIEQKVAKLLAIYKIDRFVGENLMRVSALIKTPIARFEIMFGDIDKSTSDIVGICQSYDERVVSLRRTRDDLFELYMMWEPILDGWKTVPIEKCKPAEDLIRNTFQFLARHYPQQTAWKRR